MNAPRPVEWLTLEVVARDYGVAVEWILRVEAVGVLRVERTADTVRIAASELDRLAAAMRWHLHFGMDLEVVAALLVEVDSV